MVMMKMSTWNDIMQLVLAQSVHHDVIVSKSTVPHPSTAGFTLRLGDLNGQSADFGKALPDGRGIHIREYAYTYAVHWDYVDPSIDPVGHLLRDATHWLILGCVGLFIFILGLFEWFSDK
jgi:hypothetical protein